EAVGRGGTRAYWRRYAMGDTVSSMPSSRRGFLLQVGAAPLLAQSGLLGRVWTAKWISAPGAPATEYCVCHFRRTLELTEKPARFLVHASGDNRYQLFV